MTKKDYIELSNQKLNYYEPNDSIIPTGNDFFKQYEECFNRLPCGICRLTNMPCPKVTNYEPNKITCTLNSSYEEQLDKELEEKCNKITKDLPEGFKAVAKKETTETGEQKITFSVVKTKERFEVITNSYNYTCYDLDAVIDKVNEAINTGYSYIIRYYVGDTFKGGYNLEELKEKLGVK